MKDYPKDPKVNQVNGVIVAYLYELLKLFTLNVKMCGYTSILGHLVFSGGRIWKEERFRCTEN